MTAAEKVAREIALPCGLCGGPHRYDTSIPSATWNAVIRARGLSEYLCIQCIVEQFALAGVSFEAELYGPSVDREGEVPTISVVVGRRPITETWGDLKWRLTRLAPLLEAVGRGTLPPADEIVAEIERRRADARDKQRACATVGHHKAAAKAGTAGATLASLLEWVESRRAAYAALAGSEEGDDGE